MSRPEVSGWPLQRGFSLTVAVVVAPAALVAQVGCGGSQSAGGSGGRAVTGTGGGRSSGSGGRGAPTATGGAGGGMAGGGDGLLKDGKGFPVCSVKTS